MAFLPSLYQRKEILALPFLLLGGTAIALLPFKTASAVAVGGGVFLLTLLAPTWGLYSLAFSVPFGTLGQVAVGPFAATVTEALVAILMVSWLATLMAKRIARIQVTPFLWPILLFLGIITLSVTLAPSLPLGLKELVKWIELLIVLLIAANLLRTNIESDLLIWALLAAGLSEALYGWYQFFTKSGPEGFIIGGVFMRAYGTFGQPNPFGGYMATILSFFTGLFLGLYREKSGVWPSGGETPKLLLLGGFLIAGAMLMSLSRGAWLGYLAAMVVVASFFNRRFLILMVLGGVGVMLLIFMGALEVLPQAIAARLEVLVPAFWAVDLKEIVVTPQNWPLVQRTAIWQAAWEMFKTAPLIGVGIGNFDEFYPLYALPFWREPPGHAHNYYLNLLAETGLAGLAAYLLFIGTAFGYAIRIFIRTRLADIKSIPVGYLFSPGPVALGTIGALTALSVHNLFDNLYVHSMTVQIGIILGLLAALDKGDASNPKRFPPKSGEGTKGNVQHSL